MRIPLCTKVPLKVLSLLGVPVREGTIPPPAGAGAVPVPPHGRQVRQQDQGPAQGSRGPRHRCSGGSR